MNQALRYASKFNPSSPILQSLFHPITFRQISSTQAIVHIESRFNK